MGKQELLPIFASATFLGNQGLLHIYGQLFTCLQSPLQRGEVVEKVIELKLQRAVDETLSGPDNV